MILLNFPSWLCRIKRQTYNYLNFLEYESKSNQENEIKDRINSEKASDLDSGEWNLAFYLRIFLEYLIYYKIY